VLYAAAIPFAFVREWIADAICVMVARMCLVPDRRIESRFHDSAWSATTSVVNRSLNMFTINEFLAADLHARDTLSTLRNDVLVGGAIAAGGSRPAPSSPRTA